MTFFWLSYVDDDKDEFRGGVNIQAPDFITACMESRRLNLSPGGQCKGTELSWAETEADLAPFKLNTLYSEADIRKLEGN